MCVCVCVCVCERERERESSSHSLLGLDGEGEDGMRSATLSVHGSGRHSSVQPASMQNLASPQQQK